MKMETVIEIKRKKKKTTCTTVPRLRNPGIKTIQGRKKNTHKSQAWDLREITNGIICLRCGLCEGA